MENNKQPKKQPREDAKMAVKKLDFFINSTGKTMTYVSKMLSLPASTVSALRKGRNMRKARICLEEAFSFIPEDTNDFHMSKDEIIEKFTEYSEGIREENCNEPVEKTNFEYYKNHIIELANKFVVSEKQTASRATANAIRTIIPAGADTPEKAVEWLGSIHNDVYELNKAEASMLDGYFKMHSNAITTKFCNTYMYLSQAESGMFKNVPGNVTLEYLKDHAVYVE